MPAFFPPSMMMPMMPTLPPPMPATGLSPMMLSPPDFAPPMQMESTKPVVLNCCYPECNQKFSKTKLLYKHLRTSHN